MRVSSTALESGWGEVDENIENRSFHRKSVEPPNLDDDVCVLIVAAVLVRCGSLVEAVVVDPEWPKIESALLPGCYEKRLSSTEALS